MKGNVLGRFRSNLRLKILAAHLLVGAVGVATLFMVVGLIAPALFDHLMVVVTGPRLKALGHVMTPPAEEAMRALTADAFREAIVVALGWASGAAFIAAVAVSFFVSGRIAGPVRHMTDAARRIAAGRYAERVPMGEPDDLGRLAASFNEMAGALEDDERRRVELIGNVAHELRTPVANLQGYLEGVIDGVVAPTEETWAFLLSEAGRLRRLIEDLQELSRAEAKQIPVSLHPVDPRTLAQSAVWIVKSRFEERQIELKLSVPDSLPLVVADEERTVQVLTNLLGNALRYSSPPGEVEVSARHQDGMMLFQVRDTGIGIAAEHLPHLFERFYRTDRARTREAGGSGIGLTIARSLVEAMGGQIWAESPGPGQGATFSFTLPLAG
jgi:signal transduction histidine kinase